MPHHFTVTLRMVIAVTLLLLLGGSSTLMGGQIALVGLALSIFVGTITLDTGTMGPGRVELEAGSPSAPSRS